MGSLSMRESLPATHYRTREFDGRRVLLDAAIVTTGTSAYRRPDGIAVIPAALLGP